MNADSMPRQATVTPCGRPMRASRRPRWSVRIVATAIALSGVALSSAQADEMACGPLANSHGPFDYRTADRDKLGLVERPHFPPVVEALIRGNRGYLGGDLDYTLRAFPNHHRALVSVMRYGEKLKTPHPRDMTYSVECYFDRALRFRPDDVIVRMIFAQFLAKNNREAEARTQLSLAADGDKDNAFTQYNIGLIYFDLKDYDKSLVQAHKAYDMGFSRPELREKLQSLGKWTDPTTAQGVIPRSDTAAKPNQ